MTLPWKQGDYAALCKTNFGQPWRDGVPPAGPDWPEQENAYGEKMQAFLQSRKYRKSVAEGGLGWLHDARWRVTGDWAGCPTSDQSSEK